MSRLHALFLTSFLVASGAHFSIAQVISETARQERIANISAVVESDGTDMNKILDQCEDPFFPAADLPVPDMRDGMPPPGEEIMLTSPQMRLERTARIIKATGIMTSGDDRFLVTSSGRLLRVGSSFNVKLDGMDFEVTVEDADNRGYILRHEEIRSAHPYITGDSVK